MDARNIQKAGLLKRFSSFLFDFILLVLLSSLFIWLLATITGYNAYNTRLIEDYERYEEKHSVSFSITSDEYNAYTEEEKALYDRAYEDLLGDGDAVSNYTRVTFLTFFNVLFGVFLSFLILEFIIPLLFKGGVTLGKKIFGLSVMRSGGWRVNWVSLFVRTFTGKYLIETALPLALFLILLFSSSSSLIPLIIAFIFIVNILLVFCTPLNLAIHDFVADTVVVDTKQKIYESREEAEINQRGEESDE